MRPGNRVALDDLDTSASRFRQDSGSGGQGAREPCVGLAAQAECYAGACKQDFLTCERCKKILLTSPIGGES